MDRIDVPSATVDHLFTEGSPTGGVAATTVSADWLNGVQEELINVIVSAGITPNKSVNTQVLAALKSIFSGTGGNGASDYVTIPFSDKASGVARKLFLQWGVRPGTSVPATGSVTNTITLPIAMPTAVLSCAGSVTNQALCDVQVRAGSLTTIQAVLNNNSPAPLTIAHTWIAIGI